MSENKSPIKAIKEFCLQCCGYQSNEVKNCTAPNCPLYDFRLGKNPYAKRNYSPEQRAAMSERMKKARENKGKNKNESND